MSSEPKVYVGILNNLQSIIEQDGLVAGDKIPSERELSERLKVGRSSVREALRALELLGVIETRRGEGTFIKDIGKHHLVPLLGTFLLKNSKASANLEETKLLIEQNVLMLAALRANDASIREISRYLQEGTVDYEQFFKMIIEISDNSLLERIWLVLNEYSQVFKAQPLAHEPACYQKIVDGMAKRDPMIAIRAFEEMTGKKIVD